MVKELSTREMRHFFLQNVIAFGAIFIALGFIMTTFLNRTAYQDIDNKLHTIARSNIFLPSIDGNGFTVIPDTQDIPDFSVGGFGQVGFSTQIIFWTHDHQQIDGATQNELRNVAMQMNFDDLNENQVQEISVRDTFGDLMYFRSLLVPIRVANVPNISYVQVFSNTNQIRDSVQHFEQIIVISMIVFWLLSLFVSLYLAKSAMAPLILSWKKQQEFVENASHELRTPLAVIQNKLELLFTHPETSVLENSEQIAGSLGEIRRLRNLTSDLLTLARRDGTQISVEKETLNLGEFIQKLTNDYVVLAEMEEKTLFYEAIDSDQEVQIDPKLIRQLLVILMDNAIKYTQAKDEIMIVSIVKKNEIELSVKDTGLGIDDTAKRKIFDRFARVDTSRNKQTGGFGLGLAIAQQIVEQLHGKIKVSNHAPKGTVFTIHLPK